MCIRDREILVTTVASYHHETVWCNLIVRSVACMHVIFLPLTTKDFGLNQVLNQVGGKVKKSDVSLRLKNNRASPK